MDSPSSPPLLPPELTLLLTIRFSASIPDVRLQVLSPSTTTGAGLKQLIRAELPSDLSVRRLRLIYSGRALEDEVSLAKGLKLGFGVGARDDWYNYDYPIVPGAEGYDGGTGVEIGKGKGKEKEKAPRVRNDLEDAAAAQMQAEKSRIYIHCSIGDIVLSDEDLAAEATMAEIQPDGQKPQQGQRGGGEGQTAQSNTEAAPRGFDRLLSAGFTATEIAALRSQFLALQSLAHTPDTMPRGEALRRLEDRWMDEGSTRDGMQSTGGLDGGLTDGGSGQGLDDMLWGCVMGFFWPVGCALWLLREEGVWSWRKGLAVFVGVVVNFGFGMMRAF